jgi:cytochrome P450
MSLPPGPRAPAFVQTARFIKDPLGYVRRSVDRYGESVTLNMAGFGRIVLFTNPAHLKEMFTAPAETLRAGESNYPVFGPITGTETVFAYDENQHLKRRRLLLPPFHGERMHEYAQVMQRLTLGALGAWPAGSTFAAHPQLQGITLRVILATVFGLREAGSDDPLPRALTRVANEAVASPLLLAPFLRLNLGRHSPWGRVLHILREADAHLYDEIRRRREAGDAGDRNDILSMLLQIRDDHGEGLTDRELRDELTTMLAAGHETTGTSLAWALECILSRPAVLERVRAEVHAMGDGGDLGRDGWARLEYLDAVIKETIRLRPIMPFGGSRKLRAPYTIAGFDLPAGIFVSNCLSMLHRRADLYPEPDEFRPERFLGKKTDPYEWTPFGGGTRRCLGMAFALFEMKVVLATLLAHARLRLAPGEIKPAPRGFFIAPSGGLPVVYEGRLERPSAVRAQA